MADLPNPVEGVKEAGNNAADALNLHGKNRLLIIFLLVGGGAIGLLYLIHRNAQHVTAPTAASGATANPVDAANAPIDGTGVPPVQQTGITQAQYQALQADVNATRTDASIAANYANKQPVAPTKSKPAPPRKVQPIGPAKPITTAHAARPAAHPVTAHPVNHVDMYDG